MLVDAVAVAAGDDDVDGDSGVFWDSEDLAAAPPRRLRRRLWKQGGGEARKADEVNSDKGDEAGDAATVFDLDETRRKIVAKKQEHCTNT